MSHVIAVDTYIRITILSKNDYCADHDTEDFNSSREYDELLYEFNQRLHADSGRLNSIERDGSPTGEVHFLINNPVATAAPADIIDFLEQSPIVIEYDEEPSQCIILDSDYDGHSPAVFGYGNVGYYLAL